MAQSPAFWQRTTLCGAAFLVLTAASIDEVQAQHPAPVRVADPGAQDEYSSVESDALFESYRRYDEPPPPPFDFFTPTWAPCQSLRTNRSVVLGHLWFGMDILGWSTKGVHAPALVTASSLADQGVIGAPTTNVLFGDEFFHDTMRPGGRLTIGWWFHPDQISGVEWHYMELDGLNVRFDVESDTANNILARPITNADSDSPDAVPFASDTLAGRIEVLSDLQLTSTGIVFRDLFWGTPFLRIDYLVGYRHVHLFDRLRVNESLVSLDSGSGFDADATILRVDQFRAVNQFDGADLGIKTWWSPTGKIAITGLAKAAIGSSNNAVLINGFTRVRSGGDITTTEGGVLAQPSNIGRRSQQEFAVVGEVGLGVEWTPACWWKFSAGYNWFYWSDVARAIEQVDTTVDIDQLAPTNDTGDRPDFNARISSFWAQGLTAGFTYQF
jgi:hypothetical protein